MNKIRTYVSEYADELLYKVEWPSFEELQSNTINVFVSCLALAFIIFIMDFLFGTVMTEVYKFF